LDKEEEESAEVTCDFCQEAFARKNLLKDHLIAVHNLSEADARVGAKMKARPGAPDSASASGEEDSQSQVPPGSDSQSRTTCPLCPKQHKRREYLASHLVNKHGKTEEEAKTMSGLDSKSPQRLGCLKN
jgi:hypothetical protein